jgi:hypothetical protein
MLTCVIAAFLLAVAAHAAQLVVQSPIEGGYLGVNNTLNFQITGVVYQTTVTAVITGPNGNVTSATGKFTPNDNTDTITSSLPVTFNASSPPGAYTIVVSATSPNTTINSVTVHVTVIVTPPALLAWTPLTGAYVQGVVQIRALTSSTQLQSWRVQVNNQDIPNNVGASSMIDVPWDTTNFKNQSPNTITIVLTDLAGNTSTTTMNVTVDRTPPVITVIYPQSGVKLIAGSQISVIVNITVPAAAEMDRTGIDVIAQTTTGSYLTRVAFVSATALNSTTFQWTGRILTSTVKLPKTFQLKVTAVDLAGNSATPQVSTVNLQ